MGFSWWFMDGDLFPHPCISNVPLNAWLGLSVLILTLLFNISRWLILFISDHKWRMDALAKVFPDENDVYHFYYFHCYGFCNWPIMLEHYWGISRILPSYCNGQASSIPFRYASTLLALGAKLPMNVMVFCWSYYGTDSYLNHIWFIWVSYQSPLVIYALTS